MIGNRSTRCVLGVVLTGVLLSGCGNGSSSIAQPFDHSYAAYAQLLDRHVDDRGWVNYNSLTSDSTLLESAVHSFLTVPRDTVRAFSDEQKLAFWINAYNLLTLQSIVESYPVKSIKDINGVWDKRTFPIGGQGVTLNDIEHEILRKDFAEPRIHFALVCASVSCPALLNRPFLPETIDAQLTQSVIRFLSDTTRNRFDPETKTAQLSEIFSWYGSDFGKTFPTDKPSDQPEKLRPVLNYIAATLPDSVAGFLVETGAKVSFLPYDWNLNSQQTTRETK